ncbi:MAG: biotin--[acetyl-CoA-carboxylase] ligase [Candidatus Omnitrophica bacterium]|nr:biotin--[acetyl-CoA-carboxylase] ligase [Candidatus Omnitrophota bacterium]
MRNKILNYLKASQDFVSGEEISRALAVSRTAVWKYIKQLQGEGFSIEAVSHRGYRLCKEPDKLFPESVQANLKTKVFGKEIIYFESIDSTMDLASKFASEGAQEGTIICAEQQIKGRGRLGRNWVSPKGKGIYFSVILRPRISLSFASQLTLVFAVALCQAIRVSTGMKAVIKWPNDILVNRKKAVGILTELNAEMDRINFVILGVGVNVSGKLPPSLSQATCLEKETDQKISRVELFKEILRQMEKYYELFHQKGFAPIADTWRSLSATLNTKVKVLELNKITQGTAVDIDAQGALLIRERSGAIVKKISGDIVHLRHAPLENKKRGYQ